MKAKQPTPKPGYEFTGWATFNWGVCHQRVYRTRKEGKKEILSWYEPGTVWDSTMDSVYKIVKVKCIVL